MRPMAIDTPGAMISAADAAYGSTVLLDKQSANAMAFRFRLDEPIQKEFRRIGMDQIERARRQLAAGADPATEVHEARKCIKRIRALLRLGREGLGGAVFRAENARFRSIAAMLAPARDSHVLAETLSALDADASAGQREALARFKTALAAATPASKPAEGQGGVNADALVALDRALRRFRRLDLKPDNFSVLAAGMTRSYRRGVIAFEAAYATESDEAFHDWRKAVQAHWRHMQLISRAWPALIEARVVAARALSQILGDDHDLALVRQRLESLPGGTLDAGDTREITRMIADRQRDLRARARPRGHMIFAERPKAHGRWITALWKAAVARERIEAEAPAEPPVAPPPKARARSSAPVSSST